MTSFEFGDIVLLTFPFTNGVQKKKRPALILLDADDGDVILCRITSKKVETKYDFILEEWKNFNLLLPSVIRMHKIATLDKKLIERKLGKLNVATKQTFTNFIRPMLTKFLK